MEQVQPPDGYEVVDREKEPDAVIGAGWMWWAGKMGGWRSSGKPGALADCHPTCIYARPIRKRKLWVKAGERQPPVGVSVPMCDTPKLPGITGWWHRHSETDDMPSRMIWLDLDAADAIEAERDRLAAQCAEHANRIAELEREIAPRKENEKPTEHCVGCQLFDGHNGDFGGKGTCHRFPEPRGIYNPEVHWCGEFKPKLEFNINDAMERESTPQVPWISINEY